MKIQLELFDRILEYPMYNHFEEYDMDKYNSYLEKVKKQRYHPHNFFKTLNDVLKNDKSSPIGPLFIKDKYINDLIIDFESQEKNKQLIAESKETHDSIVDIEIPFDSVPAKEFYYYLICNEALRIVCQVKASIKILENTKSRHRLRNPNAYLAIVALSMRDNISVNQLVNDIFHRLKNLYRRLLRKKADFMLHPKGSERTKNSASDVESLNIKHKFSDLFVRYNETENVNEYILNVLHLNITWILYEFQFSYKSEISMNHDLFEIGFIPLDVNTSNIIFDNYSTMSLKHYVRYFIRSQEYRIERAQTLMEQLDDKIIEISKDESLNEKVANRKKNKLINYLRALKNLIFIKEQNLKVKDKDITYANLINKQFQQSCFQEFQTMIRDTAQARTTPVEKTEHLRTVFWDLQDISLQNSLQDSIHSLPKRAMEWLTEEIEFYKANPELTPEQMERLNSGKIETNLSVPDIAFLFRALNEKKLVKKPDPKTQLFKAISESFSSKDQQNISFNTIKRYYDNPDESSVNKWSSWFDQLMQSANLEKKDKS